MLRVAGTASRWTTSESKSTCSKPVLRWDWIVSVTGSILPTRVDNCVTNLRSESNDASHGHGTPSPGLGNGTPRALERRGGFHEFCRRASLFTLGQVNRGWRLQSLSSIHGRPQLMLSMWWDTGTCANDTLKTWL